MFAKTLRIKSGEYLFVKGEFKKRIVRNWYNGDWDVRSAESIAGIPPFALGFRTKKRGCGIFRPIG